MAKVYLVATGETHEGRETFTRHEEAPPLSDYEELVSVDALEDSAARKLAAGEPLTKDEANARIAASLFNPTNQVFFRAGMIACRESLARFVEAQSPEVAASIRANWWPRLGADFGPPRLMRWGELVEGGGDEPPIKCRDDISPTLEALPIALQFLEQPDLPPNTPYRMQMVEPPTSGVVVADHQVKRPSDADASKDSP